MLMSRFQPLRAGRGAIVALLAAVALMLTPVAVFAQTSAPASPAHGASASAKPSAGAGALPGSAPASASAVASAAASTGGASASASAPAVRGVPTPVGGNAPKELPEPTPYFAYLLIVLGGIWFFAAIAGIVRLMSRPRGVAYTADIPDAERDRPFLSFIMPFGALITVAVIVTIWGLLFLQTSHLSELYPLAIDLFVVCLVMLIATVAALRGGGQARTEVH